MIEQAAKFIADSVEPQYIAPAGALQVELELRCGNVEAAREAADEGDRPDRVLQRRRGADGADLGRRDGGRGGGGRTGARRRRHRRAGGRTAARRARGGADRGGGDENGRGAASSAPTRLTAEAQLARARDDADAGGAGGRRGRCLGRPAAPLPGGDVPLARGGGAGRRAASARRRAPPRRRRWRRRRSSARSGWPPRSPA